MSRPGAVHFAMTHTAAGGLIELWDGIAEGLADRGYDVARFVLYPPAETVTRAEALAWTYISADRPRSPLAVAALVFRLVRYLRRERPAAVICAMPAANVLLPIAVTLARVPTRVLPSHHSPTDTHHRLLDRVDSWTGSLPSVARVISVSHAVAASLAHKPRRYRDKIATIHNALSQKVEELLEDLRRQERRTEEPFRVVAIGRLTAQKNYPMLIRAMVLLPDSRLEIIGGGEDEVALRELVRELGLGERITFTGPLARADALGRVAAADVFVQVSLFEGHSLALIEAARLGLPIVVSDVPVQVEGVTAEDETRCGITVPLGDERALADALDHLRLDRSARRAWAELAHRLGREASNKRMLDRYEVTLAEVLEAAKVPE